MKQMIVEAKRENLDMVISFISEFMEEAQFSPKKIIQLELAAEEIFVNVASYAYGSSSGEISITEDTESDGRFKLVFSDEGIPFNPLESKDPDVTLTAGERQIGGLGILLVKKNTDDIHYEYIDGKNILTIYKNK